MEIVAGHCAAKNKSAKKYGNLKIKQQTGLYHHEHRATGDEKAAEDEKIKDFPEK